jgi:D-arabinose 1-dehydrogenase-like Zn-dependent alcohol dehydrogenase
MADVVLNSLGVGTYDSSFASVGINRKGVIFDGLISADLVQSLYTEQIKLIGSTGGTRKELQELLIDMSSSKELKVRIRKKFKLEDVTVVFQALLAKERDG